MGLGNYHVAKFFKCPSSITWTKEFAIEENLPVNPFAIFDAIQQGSIHSSVAEDTKIPLNLLKNLVGLTAFCKDKPAYLQLQDYSRTDAEVKPLACLSIRAGPFFA